MGSLLRLIRPPAGFVGLYRQPRDRACERRRMVASGSRSARSSTSVPIWPERRPELRLGLTQRGPDVPMVERELGLQPAVGLVELQDVEVARLSVSRARAGSRKR